MPYIGRELERGTYLKLDDIQVNYDEVLSLWVDLQQNVDNLLGHGLPKK